MTSPPPRPRGIVVSAGATATVSGTTLSGNLASSVGIDLEPTVIGPDTVLPGDTTIGSASCSGAANTVIGYADGIAVSGDTNAGDTPVGNPTITVARNVIGGAGTGIVAHDTVAGSSPGDVNLTVACNNISDAISGTGIALEGAQGERVGGAFSNFGNTLEVDAVGLAVLPCSSCSPALNSTGNLIGHNVVGTAAGNGNTEFGVLIGGLSTPPEFGGPYPDQGGNTFLSNKWVGNGTTAEIFGANVLDGSGDGANAPVTCSCVLGAPGLPANHTPTSIPVKNTGGSTVLAQGSIITVGGANYGRSTPPGLGNVAQFYVSTNQTLPGTPSGVTTNISVTEIVPAPGLLDTPFVAIAQGAALSVSRLSTGASSNSYSGNSCAPDLGGSATLNTGSSTPSPGYDAC